MPGGIGACRAQRRVILRSESLARWGTFCLPGRINRRRHLRRPVVTCASGDASSTVRMGHRLASGLLAFIAALGIASGPSFAVTTEQLLYLEAWRAVDRAYVDKTFNGNNWFMVREKALKKEKMGSQEETYDAIRKTLALLGDPFTRFLEPERLSAIRSSTKSSVTGVGLEIAFESEGSAASSQVVVLSPQQGGPADRAGIKPSTKIISVGGIPTAGKSLYEVADLLRGDEGTAVTLTVKGPGDKASKDIELTRERVAIKALTYAACKGSQSVGGPEGTIGYIRLQAFNAQSTAEAKEAISSLQQAGVSKFVFDLRNNVGGYFPAAVEIGRLLIDSGDIVLVADSEGVRDIYSATRTAIETQRPMAVLVNKGTASASEVLTGALKDNGRATVVGERTFGKGLIQTIVTLSDGSGVAVTVAKYQTPAGTDINGVGIQPDIPLSKDIPTGVEGFCRVAEMTDAPKLFL